MLVLIVSAIWAVIALVVGLIVAAGRTGPEEAIKNLSLWLQHVGVEDPQGWLREKWKSRRLRLLGAAAFGLLLVAGIFTAGMVVGEKFSEGGTAGPARPGNHWPPLSDKEAVALRDEFRKLPSQKLTVLCAIPACADLAESIFDVSSGMKWPGTYASNYFQDDGIRPGIEIWSYPKRIKERDVIAAAIERATNGRLKISSQTWPLDPPNDAENDISLVIGRAR